MAVLGLRLGRSKLAIILMGPTGVYHTQRHRWGLSENLEPLHRVLCYIIKPPPSMIDPTITRGQILKIDENVEGVCRMYDTGADPIGRRTVIFQTVGEPNIKMLKEPYRRPLINGEIITEGGIIEGAHSPEDIPGVICQNFTG